MCLSIYLETLKPFQFLNIAVLREYLALEFSDLELPFVMDPERLVDDFVMMCFFVGNDFLPHMPTLDIREKGIELMIKVYRDTLPYLGGYMANGASLCMHLQYGMDVLLRIGCSRLVGIGNSRAAHEVGSNLRMTCRGRLGSAPGWAVHCSRGTVRGQDISGAHA